MNFAYEVSRRAIPRTPPVSTQPNSNNPPQPPSVRPRTDQTSLLKQAEPKKLSGLKLKVAYVVFKSAVFLGRSDFTGKLIDLGVLEGAKTETEIRHFIADLCQSEDANALEAMLKHASENDKFCKAFQDHIYNNNFDLDSSHNRDLLLMIFRNKPDILLGKTCKQRRTLIEKCIFGAFYVETAKSLISSIPPEYYQNVYPDENARSTLLNKILKLENVAIFDAVQKKIQFQPEELERAFCTAIKESALSTKLEKRMIQEMVKGQDACKIGGKILAICIQHDRKEFSEETLKHWHPSNADELETVIRAAAYKGMTDVVERLARAANELPNLHLSGYQLVRAVLEAGGAKNIQALIDGGVELSTQEKESIITSFRLSKNAAKTLREGTPNVVGAITDNNIERVLHHAKRAKIAKQNEMLDEWLSLAAREGRMEIVEALYTAGACFEGGNVATMGVTLHALCKHPYCDVTKNLINEAEKINPGVLEIRSKDGRTPLIEAADCGNITMVKFLVSKNANISAKDKDENNALHHAIKKRHHDVIAELFKHVHPSADEARALIKLAVERSQDSIVEFVARKLKEMSPSSKVYDAVNALVDVYEKHRVDLGILELIHAGLDRTDKQFADLIRRFDNEYQNYMKSYKRPADAIVMDVFEHGKNSSIA